MDELLHARVEQLKVIEERLDRARRLTHPSSSGLAFLEEIIREIRDMIAAAEREHAEF